MTGFNEGWLKDTARATGASIFQIENSCRRLMASGLMKLDHLGIPQASGEALTMTVTDKDLEETRVQVNVERRQEVLARMRRRA